jgi:hypothetical protein
MWRFRFLPPSGAEAQRRANLQNGKKSKVSSAGFCSPVLTPDLGFVRRAAIEALQDRANLTDSSAVLLLPIFGDDFH